MKLPVVDKLISNKYVIIDAKGTVICKDIDNVRNQSFITDACNNFEKTINILRRLKETKRLDTGLKLEIDNLLFDLDSGG